MKQTSVVVVQQAIMQNQDPEIQAKLMAMQKQMGTTKTVTQPTQGQQLQTSQQKIVTVSGAHQQSVIQVKQKAAADERC